MDNVFKILSDIRVIIAIAVLVVLIINIDGGYLTGYVSHVSLFIY